MFTLTQLERMYRLQVILIPKIKISTLVALVCYVSWNAQVMVGSLRENWNG